MEFNQIKIKNHLTMLDYYKNKINKDNYNEILSFIYRYIKDVTPFYYNNPQYLSLYKTLRDTILEIEKKIGKIYITDISFIYNPREKTDYILDYIIQKTRQHLLSIYYHCSMIDISSPLTYDLNFANYCEEAANYVQQLCIDNDIDCGLLYIPPGFDKEANLFQGLGDHYANLVQYNGDYYVIDVTYSQFFSAKTNNLERLGIVYLSGCDVGTFMLQSEEGNKISDELIKKGYMKMTEEMLKTYLDAFTISYRNGLYYENTKDYSFTSHYSIDDYERFLAGEDSQIKHENREYLGYQTKPLKNSRLSFKCK